MAVMVDHTHKYYHYQCEHVPPAVDMGHGSVEFDLFGSSIANCCKKKSFHSRTDRISLISLSNSKNLSLLLSPCPCSFAS